MDTILLKSTWIKNMIARVVGQKVHTKTGYQMIFGFDEISVDTTDTDVVISVKGRVKMDKKKFEEMIKGLI